MSFGKKPSYSAPPQTPPTVAATPPEPEEVATAPALTEDAVNRRSATSRSKGTSALRIKLNLGGARASGKGTGHGLVI